jgi:hypothetical protein
MRFLLLMGMLLVACAPLTVSTIDHATSPLAPCDPATSVNQGDDSQTSVYVCGSLYTLTLSPKWKVDGTLNPSPAPVPQAGWVYCGIPSPSLTWSSAIQGYQNFLWECMNPYTGTPTSSDELDYYYWFASLSPNVYVPHYAITPPPVPIGPVPCTTGVVVDQPQVAIYNCDSPFDPVGNLENWTVVANHTAYQTNMEGSQLSLNCLLLAYQRTTWVSNPTIAVVQCTQSGKLLPGLVVQATGNTNLPLQPFVLSK